VTGPLPPLPARASGLLLHPTALPGEGPCGTLGDEAFAFVDRLAEAGQHWWQVLPLGPTGWGDSPYQGFSAFAGNPLLVSVERLAREGLVPASLRPAAPGPDAPVDFGAAQALAARVGAALAESLERPRWRDDVAGFRERTPWLADHSLFMALREAHGGTAWSRWPEPVRDRRPEALLEARRALAPAIAACEALEWAFERQWQALRAHAHARGVRLLGDAPIFLSLESTDVWARRELFDLDPDGEPRVLSGVPPDYFNRTGQLWGNPQYRWDVHAADDFAWWRARAASLLSLVDRARLDHFIGFVRYWEIPRGAQDAVVGTWRQGPGEPLFRALERELGGLPFVAEDLGETGPDVEALRDGLGLPGMRVLQFAFDDGPDHPFLPHMHVPNSVVYTGTHDNDTTHGWWATRPEAERRAVREYLGPSCGDIAWDLIHAGLGSVAATFVTPVQDVLSLGTEARFNRPGSASGNWGWRLAPGQFGPAAVDRLGAATRAAGRDAH